MGSAEVLIIVQVDDAQADPASATGLTMASTIDLNDAINAVHGFHVELIRPTGPVMPTLPGGNARVDFRAPPEPPG